MTAALATRIAALRAKGRTPAEIAAKLLVKLQVVQSHFDLPLPPAPAVSDPQPSDERRHLPAAASTGASRDAGPGHLSSGPGPHDPIGCRWIDGDTRKIWRYCQHDLQAGSPYCPLHHAQSRKRLQVGDAA